jgi:hypothetical protein
MQNTFNGWFDLNHCRGLQSCRQLPAECIADCSGPGPADNAVEFWVNRLAFDGPAWLFRHYLQEMGCWDRAELCDHEQNKRRVLWIWAGYAAEEPGAYDFLYLG